MPQHTSTRQTANTAGAADGEVLPPDNDEEPTPDDAITTPEADASATTGSKSAAGDGSSAADEDEAEASADAEGEQGEQKATASEGVVEASSDATAEPASDTVPEGASDTPKSGTAEDADTTLDSSTPEPTDSEVPGPEAAASEATETAPDTEAEASATEAESDPDAAPAPTPRTWTSPLGLRRRTRAWRGKHPVAARVASWSVTVLAAALVYVCLQMPTTMNSLKLTEFMRLPAEAIMGAVVLISLPRRPRIVLAAVSGVLTAVVAILNMLDMGFNEYLGRGFNVILDWSLFADAQSYLKDTFGGAATTGITVALILFVLLLIVLVSLATVRLANLLAAHKAHASRGALIAGTVWITCTAFGLQVSGVPLAADHTAAILKLRTVAVRNTLRDEAEFKKVAKVDAFGNTPGSQLVPDLRGKDMIFTFIESYGRSAIEDPIMAPGVDETLAADTKALSKAGFAAKSGWLTSATYGGSSWLGHSTTMSGLWVSNQQRYRTVMASDHLSLTDAFKKTGDYDTVGVMPGVQKGWPEQSFYGLDKVYNAFQLGYEGPKFSWSTMPDQYALEQFQKQVHSKPRTDGKSLMSMIILTSSHQPWAPIPKLVPWDQLGNGSIFDSIEKAGNKASDVIADTTKSRQEYGKSIQYSVNSLTQWLERYGNDNTVLVFLGDHQPIARVSGSHASRDVPISIVAKDPKVLAKVDSWNWTDGLRPAHDAPVWKMSAFRDKFLTAYGSTPHPKEN